MKRTPLERKTPLKRGDSQLARSELKRSPISRKRSKSVELPGVVKARKAWKAGAVGKPCAVCGSRRNVQAHHIIQKSWLRDTFAHVRLASDMVRILWDPRNRLPVCELCHTRHHRALPKIDVSVLRRHAAEVFTFARELGEAAVARLERDYSNQTNEGK